jgi:hypothetical protein
MKLRPSSSFSSRRPSQDDLACEECGAHADAERLALCSVLGEAIEFAIDHASSISCRDREDLTALEELRSFVRASFAGHPASIGMRELLHAVGVLLGALAAPGERATAADPELHLAVRRVHHLADLAHEHRTALDPIDERRASPRTAPVPSRASRRKVARGSSSLSAA